MQLSHTPDIGRSLALALYAVVTSLSAAAAFICGGALLEFLEPVMASARLTLFGTPFDHYKMLFIIATGLRLTSVLVFLPRVWNEKGLKTTDVYKEIAGRLVYNVKKLRFSVFVEIRRRKFLKAEREKELALEQTETDLSISENAAVKSITNAAAPSAHEDANAPDQENQLTPK
jgi:hypothetical protein